MLFHRLHTSTPLPLHFNNPFNYQPHPLCLQAAAEVKQRVLAHPIWRAETQDGKMFGVLVVERMESGSQPTLGYVAAYSGQLGGRSDWDGFVPAVFDYLQPDGYFKQHEQQITALNQQIESLLSDAARAAALQQLQALQHTADHDIACYRQQMQAAKELRNQQRQAGITAPEADRLIAESQFMKAELHRIKKRYREQIAEATARLQQFDTPIARLKAQRRQQSDALQRWLFSRFVMYNARGEQRDLLQLFASTAQHVPPAGTGECCAPKLLQYAFTHGLRPVCMAEFWMGKSPDTEVRHEGCFYPACQGKCKTTLDFMLQGLTIDSSDTPIPASGQLRMLYEDDAVAVVSKPAGMLSVPGKSSAPSVYSLMRERYPDAESPLIVHRLDMDTSGLLLIAKTKESHYRLQASFKNHEIKKRYVAWLDGVLPPDKNQGCIALPLKPDYLNRPRQQVDRQNGKPAITRYQVLGRHQGRTLVALYPLTGRTHQLRVHCAHPYGLNTPIVGDPLYGHKQQRLLLHAQLISFPHPVTQQPLTFQTTENSFSLAPFQITNEPMPTAK